MDPELLKKAAESTMRTGRKSEHGVQRLHLLDKPSVRWLRNTPRDVSRVEPGLMQTFLRLARGEERWPLYLYGPTGRGKTLAGLCFTDRVRPSAYCTTWELSDMVFQRDAYIWRTTREVKLLVLDELGTRTNITDPHYEAVKRCLDDRELHANRVAIYISNLAPPQLAALYDDRIASRACCGVPYEVQGPDLRRSEP